MTAFVTGATGLIGRHLVEHLLRERSGDIVVHVDASSSLPQLEQLRRSWRGADRVEAVVGDLSRPWLGLDPAWIGRRAGSFDHLFHLAAGYDMTASARRNAEVTVGGTREALAAAAALRVTTFHHVSSLAVAGTHRGAYDETMFDVGQRLPSAYHQTTFDAERAVRDQGEVAWRVYRPGVVVGHSRTGRIDTVDGPYYFFPLLKLLRDTLPQWTPLLGFDLGDTHLVPVDFVVAALDHLAHRPGLDHQTFHLIGPRPQPTTDVVNAFATAAGAPRLTVLVDRRVVSPLTPRGLPGRALRRVLGSTPARLVLQQTAGRLGVPPEAITQLSSPSTFASRKTEQQLAGSGITCPDLATFATVLWDYWEQHLATTAT